MTRNDENMTAVVCHAPKDYRVEKIAGPPAGPRNDDSNRRLRDMCERPAVKGAMNDLNDQAVACRQRCNAIATDRESCVQIEPTGSVQ